MKTLFIDGARISSKEQLHKQFSAALDFPDYYGANLDALYDCLGDIDGETKICLINAAELSEKLGERFITALKKVLTDISNEYPNISVEIIE